MSGVIHVLRLCLLGPEGTACEWVKQQNAVSSDNQSSSGYFDCCNLPVEAVS